MASTSATFGLPEVTIGVIPTCAGLFRAPRAMTLNVAKQLILTGRPIDARRAYDVGLVNAGGPSPLVASSNSLVVTPAPLTITAPSPTINC